MLAELESWFSEGLKFVEDDVLPIAVFAGVAIACKYLLLQYIEREQLELPSIYYAHTRPVVRKSGGLLPVTAVTPARQGDVVENVRVRFRTVGDITCTAPVESDADTIAKIIAETASTTITERGATRLDDQTSDASMEQRKKEGYF